MAAVAQTFWLLLIAHAVTDFALQTGFLAEQKRPAAPAVDGERIWPWVLTAHALVNAGGVYVVTASVGLSLVELTAHWAIDYGKARRGFGFHIDQGLHLAGKAGLAWLAASP